MSFELFHIGITPPKELARTADEMRIAIREAAMDSSLIHNALMSREINGLSGEDTYVLLAYYALIELERNWQANMKRISLQPTPSFITPDKPEGKQ